MSRADYAAMYGPTTGDGVRIAYRIDGDARLPVLVLSNS
ncbi:MAG: hypothetical protein E2577_12660, partial [Starkeya sp.]|nr:hypothetical protein [Starkeya sp.]